MAAGLAWYVAHTLLGHPQPFFAPSAAALSFSKRRVLRGQRALQLIAGVLLGIGAGTAVRAVAGPAPGASGALAIAAAAAIVLIAALALGGGFLEEGVLFVNQAATSAILMIAVAGVATGPERLTDALIGGGTALLITVILFPANPLPLIQDATRELFAALRDTLAALADSPGTDADLSVDADGGPCVGASPGPGPEWALAAAQHLNNQLAALHQARTAALQVAILAPRRWPQRPRVRHASAQAAPLELLTATAISLAHAATATAVTQPPPPALRQALRELTAAFAALAAPGTPDRYQAAAHATRARTILATAATPHAQLTAALTRTCAAELEAVLD